MQKKKLFELVVKQGLVENIEEAKKIIMAGLVVVDGHRIDKVGTLIDKKSEIRLKKRLPYVSRGGLKLEKAVKLFDINFQDKTVIDIGASTGGFTDVSLKFGAKKVYAVDVGKALLHNSLLNNSKVVCLAKTNY